MVEVDQPLPTGSVFIVQEHPDYDYSSAGEYGPIVTLLAAYDKLYDMDLTRRKLFSKLHKFSELDYLLLTGHPAAIALAAMIAAEVNNGRVKVLIWDRRLKRYHAAQITLPVTL